MFVRLFKFKFNSYFYTLFQTKMFANPSKPTLREYHRVASERKNRKRSDRGVRGGWGGRCIWFSRFALRLVTRTQFSRNCFEAFDDRRKTLEKRGLYTVQDNHSDNIVSISFPTSRSCQLNVETVLKNTSITDSFVVAETPFDKVKVLIKNLI